MEAIVRPLVRWRFSTFEPLNFAAILLSYLHINGLNSYLCLQGGWENQLAKFLQVVGDFNAEHGDVVMRMFVSTLEGEVRAWYKSLIDASIDGWDSFQERFIERWANTRDIFLLYTIFLIIKKHESETIFQLNARFSKFYNQIPYRVRSNEVVALIYYLEAFDGVFRFFLRNVYPQNM
jgi:hypothetical protein